MGHIYNFDFDEKETQLLVNALRLAKQKADELADASRQIGHEHCSIQFRDYSLRLGDVLDKVALKYFKP